MFCQRHDRTSTPVQLANYDEAKMVVKWSKTTHAKGYKKTSERCRDTVNSEASPMKIGAEITMQDTMGEESNRDRTTTGN